MYYGIYSIIIIKNLKLTSLPPILSRTPIMKAKELKEMP